MMDGKRSESLPLKLSFNHRRHITGACMVYINGCIIWSLRTVCFWSHYVYKPLWHLILYWIGVRHQRLASSVLFSMTSSRLAYKLYIASCVDSLQASSPSRAFDSLVTHFASTNFCIVLYCIPNEVSVVIWISLYINKLTSGWRNNSVTWSFESL